jgi:hypothetical protein
MAETFSADSNKGAFTAVTYNAIIDEQIAKLKAAALGGPPVDKILIIINTHGAEKAINNQDGTTPYTHLISSTGPEKFVSLDKLTELTNLVKGTNTKLAIIDGSCHSGNSLPLANSNTCVISAAGPNHYGYNDFTQKFASKLATGKNLENIFLEVRDEVDGTGFPMISSPAGQAVQQAIYPLVTPYMYYHGATLPNGAQIDKIDNFLTNNSTQCLMEHREQDFKKLMELIQNIEDINIVERGFWIFRGKYKQVDLSALKLKVSNYKKIQDSYLKNLQSLNIPDLTKKEEFTVPGFLPFSYSLQEILDTDFAARISATEHDLSLFTSESDRANARVRIDIYRLALARKNILLQDQNIIDRTTILERVRSDERLTVDTAFGIAKEAQAAYDGYYKNLSKEKSHEPNPCKDFVI